MNSAIDFVNEKKATYNAEYPDLSGDYKMHYEFLRYRSAGGETSEKTSPQKGDMFSMSAWQRGQGGVDVCMWDGRRWEILSAFQANQRGVFDVFRALKKE